jgi:two-component system response regulator NreC
MGKIKRIRLLIADKGPVVRARIKTLAESHPDIEVVGEAASGRELLSKASALNPDVVSVNVVSIPETGWLDFIEILAQKSPTIKAVLVGPRDDTEDLGSLLKTAVSVVEQSVSQDRVMVGLSLRRDAALPIAGLPHEPRDVQVPRATGPPTAAVPLLSPREHEVLLLLAEGYTNREIAERIFRSSKTVEAYRANIKKKLGLRTRAEIVLYARAQGLANRTR